MYDSIVSRCVLGRETIVRQQFVGNSRVPVGTKSKRDQIPPVGIPKRIPLGHVRV